MCGEERILLGAIAGAHGVRGEVRLKSFAQVPGDIARYGELETQDGSARFRITALKAVGKSLVARIEGVTSRAAADRLKGTRLYIAASALPEAGEESWYHAELIGLRVESESGEHLGAVAGVQNFGAGDLLEIALKKQRETELLPFTKAFVPEVDLAAKRLVVVWPETMQDD